MKKIIAIIALICGISSAYSYEKFNTQEGKERAMDMLKQLKNIVATPQQGMDKDRITLTVEVINVKVARLEERIDGLESKIGEDYRDMKLSILLIKKNAELMKDVSKKLLDKINELLARRAFLFGMIKP